MSVVKVLELIGESPNSWEEACKNALDVAAKTVRGIVGIDVDHFTCKVKDNKIVAVHFNRLKKLKEDGILILAGRTLNDDEKQFGIVIYEASSEKEAKSIATEDPAVKQGIMTAEVYPYRIALIKESNISK